MRIGDPRCIPFYVIVLYISTPFLPFPIASGQPRRVSWSRVGNSSRSGPAFPSFFVVVPLLVNTRLCSIAALTVKPQTFFFDKKKGLCLTPSSSLM